MVVDLKTPLALAEVLGSLIASVIDAQAQAARATVEFIEEVGLKDAAGENGPRDLRTVRFRYSKLDENQVMQPFVVEVPLLGLVDIPMISVSKATFSFTYDVTSTAPTKPSTPAAPAGGVVAPSAAQPSIASVALAKIAQPALIKGRFTRVQPPPGTGTGTAPPQERGGLRVTVELEKAPVPVGVERVLDILELAATESAEAGGVEGDQDDDEQ